MQVRATDWCKCGHVGFTLKTFPAVSVCFGLNHRVEGYFRTMVKVTLIRWTPERSGEPQAFLGRSYRGQPRWRTRSEAIAMEGFGANMTTVQSSLATVALLLLSLLAGAGCKGHGSDK